VQEEYTAWLVGDNPQLLRLVGAPGIGKTMISSFLVDELEKRAQKTPAMTLAYYFCDNKDEKRNTAIAIIRGLLLQLLRQRHILFKYIQREYDQMKGQLFDSFDALWRILHSMLKDPNAGEVYILIDALDECEKLSRGDLLNVLAKLFIAPQPDRNLNVKFLIICRPESDIQQNLHDINGPEHGSGHLRVDSGKVNADLSKFIQVKVDDLSKKKSLPLQLKQDVEDALKNKAEGTFLWASLVIDDLYKAPKHQVRKKLLTLPKTLNEVYDRILKQIEAGSVEDARFILRWVVVARRPLTRSELAMALAISTEESYLEELDDVFRSCEPLVYLNDNNSTVNLVHQSAKEYLLSEYLQENVDLSQYHVVPDKTNFLIFEICWRYLSRDEFEQGTMIVERGSDNKLSSKDLSEEFLDDHCFLRYAAQEWQEHALAASPALVSHSVWISDNLGKMPTLRDTWLHRAASSGREAVARLLLEHKAEVDAKDEYGWTVLHRAALNGHEAVARLLLEHKAEVDAKDKDGWTMLHRVALNGHEAVARLLLEHKAEVDARDEYGWTALHWAARNGHEAVARLLLEHKAEVDAKDVYGLTALHRAAWDGREAVARLLLEHKAEVDAKDKYERTALHMAARNGHEAVVQLLELTHDIQPPHPPP
jgi:hypothetical protein